MSLPPPLIHWEQVDVNNTAPQQNAVPADANAFSSTTVATDNKKKRRADSDLDTDNDATDATKVNTVPSDSKRGNVVVRFADDEIEKMYLEFQNEYNYQESLQCFAHTCLTVCHMLERGYVSCVSLDHQIMVLSTYAILEPEDMATYTRGLVTFKWLREVAESDELNNITQAAATGNNDVGNSFATSQNFSSQAAVGAVVGSIQGPEETHDEDMGMGDIEAGGHGTEESGSGEILDGDEMDWN